MEPLVNLLQNFWDSLSGSAVSFWMNVVIPFWHSLVRWSDESLPNWAAFTKFCFRLFGIRYAARIYSFAILAPVSAVVFVIWIVRMRLSRKKRKRRR